MNLSEAVMFKDDSASITSSMEDSTYMSQTDSGRRVTSSEGQSNKDHRNHIVDPFLSSDIMSPTLSTGSHGAYSTVQSDIGSMMLPPAGEADLTEESFKLSELSNFSGQFYGNSGLFTPFQDQSISQFFPSSSEHESGQESWTNDIQSFSQPFAVGSVDAFAFQSSYQGTTPNRRSFTRPSYGSSHRSTSDGFESASAQRRPRSRKTAGPTPVAFQDQASRPFPMRQVSNADSISSAFEHSILSPSNTITSNTHAANFLDSDFIDEQSVYAPISSAVTEKSAESVAGVIDEEGDEGFFQGSLSAQNSLEENEGKLARTHPLYQATPGDDDLYHCPNEGQPGCTHKPTKLKCNYDKYVDSHLRPFRCKVGSCVGVQFSSTACLLRHEREAHGMHGHGSKPHLCSYPDCERSIPGNGFPRRYNLFDHMRRVHDYAGSTSPDRVSPPTTSSVPSIKRPNPRKRKSTSAVDDMAAPEKRPKPVHTKSNPTPVPVMTAEARRAMELQKLESEWNDRKAALVQRLQALSGPGDITAHKSAGDDWAAFLKISQRAHDLG